MGNNNFMENVQTLCVRQQRKNGVPFDITTLKTRAEVEMLEINTCQEGLTSIPQPRRCEPRWLCVSTSRAFFLLF